MKYNDQFSISLNRHMKSSSNLLSAVTVNRSVRFLTKRYVMFLMAVTLPVTIRAASIGQTFTTPEAAVASLTTAAVAGDENAIRSIFGPISVDTENTDRIQAAYDLKAFATALQQSQRIVHESDFFCVIEVGDQDWPFPVPIVKKDGRWYFDTEAGKEELLNRRIGRNELKAIASMRAYAQAQRVYASHDRDGDEVREYAQIVRSSTGWKDGLYWPPELDGSISPLGPLFADGAKAGYDDLVTEDENQVSQPFHGYYFKLINRQGANAPGGEYDYIINGNMIGGYAMIAWPADYGEGGIMTFVINQQGRLLEKNLGPKTSELAAKLSVYNPDATWARSED